MKYKIGNIVKYHDAEKETDWFIVLATKEISLTTETLKLFTNPDLSKIKNIEKIASQNLSVINGFDYMIYEIGNEDQKKDFIPVFETYIN